MGYKLKRITIRPNGTEQQIRPKWEWQPGANTVAYYPLDGDLNDYSGNNRNLTASGTPIYTTLGEKQVASFDGTWEGIYTNNNLLKGMPAFTYVAWVNPSSIASGTFLATYKQNIVATVRELNDVTTYDKSLALVDSNKAMSYNYYNGRVEPIQSGVNLSTRQMLVTVFDGTNLTTYVNTSSTSLSCGGSYTGYSNATLVVGAKTNQDQFVPYNGLLSNIIIEDKARTAEEIQKYYKSTKGNYGL